MAWFFEFTERSTLEEVRNFFSDEKECKEFVKKYRKESGSVGAFDAVAAFLLGGVKSNDCTNNYCSASQNGRKDGISTWVQNVRNWTVGDKNVTISVVNDFCDNKLLENKTLQAVYVELEQLDKWGDIEWKEDNKKKVLSLLNGSNVSNVQNGKGGSNNMGKDVNKIIEDAILSNKQVIFTGAPGTGKTFSVREYVKDKDYKFVQFHPSYDYSDFVEGLRPVVIDGQEDPTFVRMDGIFKEFCRHIVEENHNEKNYYFIVDEINRADLAKVFGELMFGLEESYRGEKNRIQTQYKNLVTYKINNAGKAEPIEKDVFKDGFYIPENLYFIGTMNDIDRSVDSMDFALRRRFSLIPFSYKNFKSLICLFVTCHGYIFSFTS